MKGIEELIERALDYIKYAPDDDEDAPHFCCHRSSHRAEAMVEAMRAVARGFHEDSDHETLSTVGSFETCDAFPCRVVN